MSQKIKFWPLKDSNEVEVVVDIEGVHLTFKLDLEEVYETEEDLMGAVRIIEENFGN